MYVMWDHWFLLISWLLKFTSLSNSTYPFNLFSDFRPVQRASFQLLCFHNVSMTLIKLLHAANDTAYKRWSCHSEYKLLCKLCRNLPFTETGAQFTVFCTSQPYGPAGWMALLLIKSVDVEINPSPTTSHQRVWICDIFYEQIHVRKQISIMYSMIEYWMHLLCACIRQAQYKYTRTCHLHK